MLVVYSLALGFTLGSVSSYIVYTAFQQAILSMRPVMYEH